MIPKFEKGGNLPKGVHKATLDEVREIFGASSAKRKWLIRNLEKIIDLAKTTGRLERVIVWSSFVSTAGNISNKTIQKYIENQSKK